MHIRRTVILEDTSSLVLQHLPWLWWAFSSRVDEGQALNTPEASLGSLLTCNVPCCDVHVEHGGPSQEALSNRRWA